MSQRSEKNPSKLTEIAVHSGQIGSITITLIVNTILLINIQNNYSAS